MSRRWVHAAFRSAVAATVVTALALPVSAASAGQSRRSPDDDAGPATVQSAGAGRARIVVPLAQPARIRDAAPLVLDGDVPLGFGRLSADRRSVVLETTRPVTSPARLRVVWSGGTVPAPRTAASADVRRPAGAQPSAPGTQPSAPGTGSPRPPEPAPPVGDPGTPGTLATSRLNYRLGDTKLRVPTGYRVELTGEVTFPTKLGTRRPVVVLLHGRHEVCGRRDGRTDFRWPCRSGYRPIPSERGYRPLADLLASHGMVVVSIAANGINANDDGAADAGAADRGHLVLAQLDLWQKWSTTDAKGPFGRKFFGALDLDTVGLMGHSRGGEGVVSALAQNAKRKARYGIRAVAPLAPVNFSRPSLRGTASLTVLPYCDGDVSDLQGVHYFDDATAGSVDRAPHAMLGVFGANHNYFNTVWTPGGWEAGTFDDASFFSEIKDPFCGKPQRLSAKQQIKVGSAYLAAFFRARLRGETGFDALFWGNTPTPASAKPARTVAAFSAAAGRRLMVNDLRAPDKNALGGLVEATGFDAALRCGGATRYDLVCFGPRARGDEPHLGRSFFRPDVPGLTQIHLVWSRSGAAWSNDIPDADADLRGYRFVSLRVARDAWAFSATPPQLEVSIRDATGAQRTVPLAGPALTTPVYTGPTVSDFWAPVPHALVVGITVPLTAFTGVDLANVDRITLTGRGGSGDITVGDLSVQK